MVSSVYKNGMHTPFKKAERILRMFLAVGVGLGVIAGGIWILSRTLGDRETLYQGKPLYYWVTQSSNAETTASNQANAVLTKDIIPQLTEAMFHDTNDSSLKMALVEKLNGLPGININFTPASSRRGEAAMALGEFGPAAKPAIPALLQALKSNDASVHGAAIAALGKIHAEPGMIIPLLIGYLDDKDLNDEAAEALGNFGNLASSAVPKLVPLLKVPDKDLHHAVVVALKKIDPEAAAKAGGK